jgi:pseudouridylate synthase / pseudouridine kinase
LCTKGKKVEKRPVIIGGTVVDITAKINYNISKQESMGTSSPGVISKSLGGVGRNVAEACFRAGGQPLFLTTVGDDTEGIEIVSKLNEFGMDTTGIEMVSDQSTAVYNALLHNDGELIAAVADMRMHSEMKSNHFDNYITNVNPSIVCIDGNIGHEYLEHVSKFCIEKNVPLLFEPTSVPKSIRIYGMNLLLLKAVKFVTPDLYEAKKMREVYYALGLTSFLTNHSEYYFKGLEMETDALLTLLNLFDNVLIKCGSRGVLVGTSRESMGNSFEMGDIQVGKRKWKISHLEPNVIREVVSVTGAGDSLVGVVIAGLSTHEQPHLISHADLLDLVKRGMKAAELTIISPLSVSPMIVPSLLFTNKQ